MASTGETPEARRIRMRNSPVALEPRNIAGRAGAGLELTGLATGGFEERVGLEDWAVAGFIGEVRLRRVVG